MSDVSSRKGHSDGEYRPAAEERLRLCACDGSAQAGDSERIAMFRFTLCRSKLLSTATRWIPRTGICRCKCRFRFLRNRSPCPGTGLIFFGGTQLKRLPQTSRLFSKARATTDLELGLSTVNYSSQFLTTAQGISGPFPSQSCCANSLSGKLYGAPDTTSGARLRIEILKS